MKILLVIEAIVICVILTLFSVFTIDGVVVRKAELQQIVSTDVSSVVEGYFESGYGADTLAETIRSTIIASAHSNLSAVNVAVPYADSEKDIVSVYIEIVFKNPNGSARSLTEHKVYIRERQEDPNSEKPYSFVRNISADYSDRLNTDSIWRTEEYAEVLNAVLAM